MTPTDLSPAGCEAGKAPLCPDFGQQKTPIIADRGYHFVRARERRQNASLALRNPPKHDFEVSRYEFSW